MMKDAEDAEYSGIGLSQHNRRYQPYLEWDKGVKDYLSKAFGEERLDAITEALCHPPKASCLRVNTLTTTSQEVLRRLEQECAVQGRGGDSAFQCWEHKLVPGVVMVKGSGPNEVKYTDDSGRLLPEVLVSRKCGEAVLRGAEAFVPGFLACEAGINEGDEVAVSMFVENEGDPPTRGTILSGAQNAASQTSHSAVPVPPLETPDAFCPCQLSEPCPQSEPTEPVTCSIHGQNPHSPAVHGAPFPPETSCISHQLNSHAFSNQSQTSEPSLLTDSSDPPVSQGVPQPIEVQQPSPHIDSSQPQKPLASSRIRQASQSRDRWFIGRGKALLSRAAIFRQEQGVAVEMTHRVYRHPSLHALTTKWVEGVFLQHLPSVIVAHILGPRAGERILDMCASPGGKTTAIAVLMQDRGEIIALDRSQTKVQQIESLAAQMGLTCIKAFKMDATCCVRDCPKLDAGADKPVADVQLAGRELGQLLADETSAESVSGGRSAAAQASGNEASLKKHSDNVATSAKLLRDEVPERLSKVRVAEDSGCSRVESERITKHGLGSTSAGVSLLSGESEPAGSHADTSAPPSKSVANAPSGVRMPKGVSGVRSSETSQERNGLGPETEQATTSGRIEAAGESRKEVPLSQVSNGASVSEDSEQSQNSSIEPRDSDRGAAYRGETSLGDCDESELGSVTASGPSKPTAGSLPSTANRSSVNPKPQSPNPSSLPPVDTSKATPNSNPHEPEPKQPTCAETSKPSTGGDRRGTPLERRAARKEARWLRSNQKRVRPEKLEPGSFDRVLLDAPCSALGLRPRLFVRGVNLQSLRQDGVYKRRFLDQAVRLVKPGGVIVYSTCTFNPGENEALVRYALDTYPCLRLVPQEPRLGGPGLVGGGDVFDGTGYREWLREGEQNLVQRFDPDSPLDTIGFFIAKFQKSVA